mgnify:CR=1 FL=1
MVVEDCAKFLESVIPVHEGVFRVSGQHSEAAAIKAAYDEHNPVNLELCRDPHTVASVLKMFLRELPEPLVPFELSRSISSSKGIKEKEIRYFKEQMPKSHKAVLKILLKLCSQTMEHKEVTKMESASLATVFSPVLSWSKSHASSATAQDQLSEVQISGIALKSIFDSIPAVLPLLE